MVQYEDYGEAKIPDQEYALPLMFKRKSFEHEREVRLICPAMLDALLVAQGLERPFTTESVGRLKSEGMRIPIKLDEVIERIYVDPMQPVWFEDVVRATVEAFHEKLLGRVVRSSLGSSPLF